jgi:hypothetical protein
MDRRVAEEVDLEAVRNLYAALGPGFAFEARRVFEGDTPSADEEWCVGDNGFGAGCFPVSELSGDRLFRLPEHWELTRVAVYKLKGRLTRRGDVVRVKGHLHCRLRGDWDVERFPFIHMWTMCAGKALSFESFLDGLELRRRSPLSGCPLPGH